MGEIEITEISLENATILGTNVVVANLTIKNPASEDIPINIETEYFDGETTIGMDGTLEYSNECNIEAGVSRRAQEGIEGRKKDVSRFEVTLLDARTS